MNGTVNSLALRRIDSVKCFDSVDSGYRLCRSVNKRQRKQFRIRHLSEERESNNSIGYQDLSRSEPIPPQSYTRMTRTRKGVSLYSCYTSWISVAANIVIPLLLLLTSRVQLSSGVLLSHINLLNGSKCYYEYPESSGLCYVLNPKQLDTWPNAYYSCIENGGQLLMKPTTTRTAVVHEIMRRQNISEAWIGITKVLIPWTWMATRSNAPPLSSLWAVNQPTSADSEQDCVILDVTQDYKMATYPCNKRAGYICEADEGSSLCQHAAVYVTEIIYHNGSCYLFVDGSRDQSKDVTWFEVANACAELSYAFDGRSVDRKSVARAANIINLELYKKIERASPGISHDVSRYWIGLTRARWISSSGLIIDHFFVDGLKTIRCVTMVASRGIVPVYKSYPCQQTSNYICQFDLMRLRDVKQSATETVTGASVTSTATTSARPTTTATGTARKATTTATNSTKAKLSTSETLVITNITPSPITKTISTATNTTTQKTAASETLVITNITPSPITKTKSTNTTTQKTAASETLVITKRTPSSPPSTLKSATRAPTNPKTTYTTTTRATNTTTTATPEALAVTTITPSRSTNRKTAAAATTTTTTTTTATNRNTARMKTTTAAAAKTDTDKTTTNRTTKKATTISPRMTSTAKTTTTNIRTTTAGVRNTTRSKTNKTATRTRRTAAASSITTVTAVPHSISSSFPTNSLETKQDDSTTAPLAKYTGIMFDQEEDYTREERLLTNHMSSLQDLNISSKRPPPITPSPVTSEKRCENLFPISVRVYVTSAIRDVSDARTINVMLQNVTRRVKATSGDVCLSVSVIPIADLLNDVDVTNTGGDDDETGDKISHAKIDVVITYCDYDGLRQYDVRRDIDVSYTILVCLSDVTTTEESETRPILDRFDFIIPASDVKALDDVITEVTNRVLNHLSSPTTPSGGTETTNWVPGDANLISTTNNFIILVATLPCLVVLLILVVVVVVIVRRKRAIQGIGAAPYLDLGNSYEKICRESVRSQSSVDNQSGYFCYDSQPTTATNQITSHSATPEQTSVTLPNDDQREHDSKSGSEERQESKNCPKLVQEPRKTVHFAWNARRSMESGQSVGKQQQKTVKVDRHSAMKRSRKGVVKINVPKHGATIYSENTPNTLFYNCWTVPSSGKT